MSFGSAFWRKLGIRGRFTTCLEKRQRGMERREGKEEEKKGGKGGRQDEPLQSSSTSPMGHTRNCSKFFTSE